MKRRYLFLAAIIASVFTSCSNDDSQAIALPEEMMVDAVISLAADVPDGGMTKASEVGSDRERFINELTAYVFYADEGTFAGMGEARSENGQSLDRIEDVAVKVKAKGKGQLSTTKLKVVLFANVKLGKTPAHISEIEDGSFAGVADYGFTDVAQGKRYLPMFSQMLTIGGTADEAESLRILAGSEYNNWIKASNSIERTDRGNVIWGGSETYDPTSNRIELTRHVARVQLEYLRCGFTNNYNTASFTLTNVYVANATNSTKLYPESGTYGLEQADGFLHGCAYKRDDYFLVAPVAGPVAALRKDYGEGHRVDNATSLEFSDLTMPQFYLFELSNKHTMKADAGGTAVVPAGRNINTLLILEGTWKYGIGQEPGETRYYRVPIRATQGGTDPGVIHNTIYRISATLTGEGSTDPDTEDLNASIKFNITVSPWKVINQTEKD